MANITTDQVWAEIEKYLFGVLGMVTAQNEARTVGIVYVVRDRVLYIGSKRETWKVKHIAANPHVSMTVTIPKSVPLMPWVKVPAATITFAGTARVLSAEEAGPEVMGLLFRGMADAEDIRKNTAIIAVEPEGDFVTYGVGVSLMEMRDTTKARGRAPVA